MIARDITVVVAENLARNVRKAVPIAFAGAIRVRRAFDLIGTRRRAPDKIGRKGGSRKIKPRRALQPNFYSM
jgi:hypothetical protein